jgi:hypothetical protein
MSGERRRKQIDRRQALSLLAATGALLAPSAAWGCVMRFEPRVVQADASGRATFTALIYLDHRRCVISLPPACVHLVPRGLRILRQEGWRRVKRALYSNTYRVELTHAGSEGSLKVWRDCSKKGISEGTIVVRPSRSRAPGDRR